MAFQPRWLLANAIKQEVHKHADLHRKHVGLRVHQPKNAFILHRPIRQHANKRTGLEVSANAPKRVCGNAGTRFGGEPETVAVVNNQAAVRVFW